MHGLLNSGGLSAVIDICGCIAHFHHYGIYTNYKGCFHVGGKSGVKTFFSGLEFDLHTTPHCIDGFFFFNLVRGIPFNIPKARS